MYTIFFATTNGYRTVEREDQDRVQAQHLPVRDGSKEVTRKNADMKSGATKKKPRDTDDTEERISEKAAVAESPTGTPETQRPVISKSLKIGNTSYKIVSLFFWNNARRRPL